MLIRHKNYISARYFIISMLMLYSAPYFAHGRLLSNNTMLYRSYNSYQFHDLLQQLNSFPIAPSPSKKNSVSLSMLSDYQQNFGCSFLGSMPFWSGKNRMTVGNNNGKADLDAYQFGLGDVAVNADGIAGVIQLDPKIQQVGTDVVVSFAHMRNDHRIFFKIHMPLVAMMVTPRLTEPVVASPLSELYQQQTTKGVPGNPSQTISFQFDDYPTLHHHQKTMSESFFGGVYQESLPTLRGNIFKLIRLRKGRISPKKQTVIRLGDLAASVGYHFLESSSGYLGVSGTFSCPTGNVPTADYMLEPIVGRAGSWTVGAEISGAYRVWHDAHQSREVDLCMQGTIVHVASGRNFNFRSFDLKQNGPGSKYLLVQNYIATVNPDPLIATGEVFSSQRIEPVINYTTLPVFSKIPVEGAVAAMIQYRHGSHNGALGFEFWGRTQEKLKIDLVTAVDLRYQSLNDFAVLGRQLAAYKIDGQGFVETNLCEPLARINKSQDPVILIGSVPNVTFDGVVLPAGIADASLSKNRIPANLDDALDIPGAQSPAICSTKLFAKWEYCWNNLHPTSKKIIVEQPKPVAKDPSLVAAQLTKFKKYVRRLWSNQSELVAPADGDQSPVKALETYTKRSVDQRYIPTIAFITGVEFVHSKDQTMKLWNLGLNLSMNF